jgi:EmrB/QacA subfamily drug resistance transporter
VSTTVGGPPTGDGGAPTEPHLDPELDVDPSNPALRTFSHAQILIMFSGLLVAMLMAAIDSTIVATALPTITGELGGLNHITWVITAYLLAQASSTPVFGKLGDLYGRKHLFLAAVLIFIVGSVLCGVAQDMAQLICFRAIQGIGGGGLYVLSQAIVADVVSPRQRGRYQGYFGAVFGLSSVAGPLLGGILTDGLSWRWVFFVNIPLGLAALVVTALTLPAGRRRAQVSVDYLGIVLVTFLTTGIVLVTTWGGTQYEWGSPTIVGLSIATVVAGVLLLVVERRVPEPVIPLALFRVRTVALMCAVAAIGGAAIVAVVSFIPLFLQVVTGASATNSGVLLLPTMVSMPFGSVASGQIISRTGHYKLLAVLGMVTATTGMLLLSFVGTDATQLGVAFDMFLLGAGLGIVSPVLVLSVQNRVHVRDLGAATSMVNYTRSIGGVFGVALCGTLFNLGLSNRLAGLEVPVGEGASISAEAFEALDPATHAQAIQALTDSLTTVFRAIVPLLLFGVVLSLFLEEVPLRDRVAPLADDGDHAYTAAPDDPSLRREPVADDRPSIPPPRLTEAPRTVETAVVPGVAAARPDA